MSVCENRKTIESLGVELIPKTVYFLNGITCIFLKQSMYFQFINKKGHMTILINLR